MQQINRSKKTQGFTLVEIMIVVLIIGVLMAIAIPQFIRARTSSRQKTVISNLRQIDSAKERWAMEAGKRSGDPVSSSDLTPNYIKTYPDDTPVSGSYLPNAVGDNPTFLSKDQTQWLSDTSGL